jgi:hypothetical protein
MASKFKTPTADMLVRVPVDLKRWLERQSQKSFASQNAEVIRCIRERMEAEQRAASSQGQRRAG